MEHEKHVDESWKENAASEKDTLAQDAGAAGQEDKAFEVNFSTYITSMIFQAMIFLGEVPNPLAEDQKVERNLKQAKVFIDTLLLLKEKTKGNLTTEEDNLLNASLYELQMKYVELSKQEGLAS